MGGPGGEGGPDPLPNTGGGEGGADTERGDLPPNETNGGLGNVSVQGLAEGEASCEIGSKNPELLR